MCNPNNKQAEVASPSQSATNSNMESLQRLIESKKATVGILGLGYVGVPLCTTFHRAGFNVMGFDIDPEKIACLEKGESYIKHLGNDTFQDLAASDRFTATTDFDRLDEADAILICVPTPLGEHFEPDLSYVLASGSSIAAKLRPGQLVVLESTTYPGTTDDELKATLDSSGLTFGKDYYLAYSPEREDPGNKNFQTAAIPKLVGGVDAASGALAVALYRSAFASVYPTASARVAESSKLVENIYRSVNIALVNELKMIFEKLDVDIWEVLDAAATKPFGFQRFNPGPGWGGHCIPIDPFYLTWKAREVGMATHFIERAGEINNQMPAYVTQHVQGALNKERKAVNGATVLLLGVSYKPDIDDIRESPAFEVWDELEALGATVVYNDAHVPELWATRKRPHLAAKRSVPLDKATLAGVDCVVLVTDHKATDLAQLQGFQGPVVDTRNAVPRNLGLNVVKA